MQTRPVDISSKYGVWPILSKRCAGNSLPTRTPEPNRTIAIVMAIPTCTNLVFIAIFTLCTGFWTLCPVSSSSSRSKSWDGQIKRGFELGLLESRPTSSTQLCPIIQRLFCASQAGDLGRLRGRSVRGSIPDIPQSMPRPPR